MSKNLKAFELLFKDFFKPLCGFAVKYVVDLEEAKNLVHEVFITVWERFDSLPADINYRSYLFTAVRNRCLNHIRDRKKIFTIEKVAEHNLAEENTALETTELQREIELAINLLPEKCRQVFELSRNEDLKYSEIAERMNISVKTVEAQMSKALSVLRTHLAEFLSLLIIMLRQ